VVQDERDAWTAFQASVAAERKQMLEKNKNACTTRIAMWENGVSEKEMLTFFGQLKNVYAKRQGLKNYDILTTGGEPISDLPGMSYASGIGAMDYLNTQKGMTVGFELSSSSLSMADDDEDDEDSDEKIDLDRLQSSRQELGGDDADSLPFGQ